MLLEVSCVFFPATCRGDTQRQAQQSMGPKTSGSGKNTWKGQNKHSKVRRFNLLTSPIELPGLLLVVEDMDISLGQTRKLPLPEQRKKIIAKQKLSPAELQQRLRTVSCINCGKHGHICEACPNPKPS